MRAISQDVLGGPEVLKEIELPRPAPGIGELLVRVHAAGLNATDWTHRRTGGSLGEPPFVLGWDVSGVVEATGMGATLFKPGDEVFGMLPYPHGAGSHAQYVTAPSRTFALKPPEIAHVQAGALPLAALTAYQALVDTAQVQPGQRVLIHAAAGGVGHLAVQIAKARGAYVIGTASAGKHDFLRSLGVDELIDYRTTDFAETVGDLDVVLDTMGGDTRSRSLPTLRPDGLLVTLKPAGEADMVAAAERLGVRAMVMAVESDHAGMNAIAALAAAGELRATIADTFPLAEAAKAHEIGERGRTTGKLVLVVR
ncbi:NADP-dependent oxidoreductase [Streptomyces fractus]|uniref:NADP-dependent oxidoreductase n=1 Tax=Streptomyces fractus TaxID=641806 RepID=UPI003CF930CC